MLETAPFLSDIAAVAPEGAAYWLDTSDGVRVRAVLWGKDAPKGTVLLFPGRTEYAEKYLHTAAALQRGGYATFAMDWRGQGLADKLLDDPMIGHVVDFPDYQKDVAAMIAAARDLELPEPYFLIAHSMGGQIGLRALMQGLPVNACVFSAPMWGILLSPALRPAVWAMTRVGRALGAGDKLAPGGRTDAYVLGEPFADNTLTTDPEMYQFMLDHLKAHPELSLAGPSLTWLHEALLDCARLAERPTPDVPCLTYLGSNERIVDPKRIHDRMNSWPEGKLVVVDGAEHEILMEMSGTRERVMAEILALFDANRDRQAQGRPVAC